MNKTKYEDGKMWKLLGDRYWVSEYGDVVCSYRNKLLSNNPRVNGYVGKSKSVCRGQSAHCAVYEAFVGEIPKGMQINHLDGNKTNNHISNLELCTAARNVQHAYETGLMVGRTGENHHNVKVTEDDVLAMYGMFKLGYPNKVVGDKFGLHDRYVSLIRHGKRWSHVWERECMTETYSLGHLSKPLPECVWIYNMCMCSGLSQDKLASYLGIDSSQVSRIRTGKAWGNFRKLFGLPESTEDWRESGNNYVINQ